MLIPLIYTSILCQTLGWTLGNELLRDDFPHDTYHLFKQPQVIKQISVQLQIA